MKKTPKPFRAIFENTMGNPIFNFFCCWSKRSNFFYNRNIDFLISKLLSKSILDFGKWSNWKYANTYLRIFSLTTSRSPKLILKAVLKWEGPFSYCKFFFGAFWLTTKKLKIGFTIVFSKCAEGLRVFFHARALIFSPNALYLPTKQPWGAPNFWFWLCPFIRTP